MKTTTTLATAILTLALTGCLAEGPDDATTDEPQTDEITTIASIAPDSIKFTGPSKICAGFNATAQLSLLSDPGEAVTLSVASSVPASLWVGPPSSFTFTSSNYAVIQPVKLWTSASAPQGYVNVTASAPGANPKTLTILVQRFHCP